MNEYVVLVVPAEKRLSPEMERFSVGTVEGLSVSFYGAKTVRDITAVRYEPRRFVALDEEFAARLAEEIAATVPGAAGW